jgi:hypothetical protein
MDVQMSSKPKHADIWKVLGKAVLLASMSFSIGSVAMSSTFSVMNFSTTQDILQRASDALTQYLLVATFWTAGCSSLLYASYGMRGLWISIAANLAIMAWIFHSYYLAFQHAARVNNLQFPKLFKLYS